MFTLYISPTQLEYKQSYNCEPNVFFRIMWPAYGCIALFKVEYVVVWLLAQVISWKITSFNPFNELTLLDPHLVLQDRNRARQHSSGTDSILFFFRPENVKTTVKGWMRSMEHHITCHISYSYTNFAINWLIPPSFLKKHSFNTLNVSWKILISIDLTCDWINC